MLRLPPYLIYSPGWFYDYYVTNGFTDCKVYIVSYHDNNELFFGPWDVNLVNFDKDRNGPLPQCSPDTHLLVLTIAEKDGNSTSDKQPIQAQYRFDPKWIKSYERNELNVAKSNRPILFGGGPADYLTPIGTLGGDLKRGIQAKHELRPDQLFMKAVRRLWQ